MKKKLPDFSVVSSDMQKLVEIEPILIMLGYDLPDETWNNIVVMADQDTRPVCEISCVEESNGIRGLCYFRWDYTDDCSNAVKFVPEDLEGIINFVETYNPNK